MEKPKHFFFKMGGVSGVSSLISGTQSQKQIRNANDSCMGEIWDLAVEWLFLREGQHGGGYLGADNDRDD